MIGLRFGSREPTRNESSLMITRASPLTGLLPGLGLDREYAGGTGQDVIQIESAANDIVEHLAASRS
jgi:hypothetical protein